MDDAIGAKSQCDLGEQSWLVAIRGIHKEQLPIGNGGQNSLLKSRGAARLECMSDHTPLHQRTRREIHIDQLHRRGGAIGPGVGLVRQENEILLREDRHRFLVPICFAPGVAIVADRHPAREGGIGGVFDIK